MISQKDVEEYLQYYFVNDRKIKSLENDINTVIFGYTTLFPVDAKNEEDLIIREREMSHFTSIDKNSEFYYLSEIVILKQYRQTKEILILLNKVIEYCIANNIKYIYSTLVSTESQKFLSNKNFNIYFEVLNEDKSRVVVKIDIDKYKKQKIKSC